MKIILLVLHIFLTSLAYGADSDINQISLEEIDHPENTELNYICNRSSFIYGFEADVGADFDEICGDKCTKKTVSKEVDYLAIKIRYPDDIILDASSVRGDNFLYTFESISYEFHGLWNINPLKKTYDQEQCTHYHPAKCEDEEMTFQISRSIYNPNNLYVSFYQGGYGLPNYVGFNLKFHSGGELYCEREGLPI